MELLQTSESSLTGQWTKIGSKVVGDSTCERIEWLVLNHLEKLGTSQSGWDTYFIDPIDNRYWLLSYPQSHNHGGGAPKLEVVPFSELKNMVYPHT